MPTLLALALALALLLDSRLPRVPGFFRIAFFIPYAVPGVIAALIWGFLYGPTFRPISQLFRAINPPLPPILSDAWMPFSLANIVIWELLGYKMIIIHAALKTIPPRARGSRQPRRRDRAEVRPALDGLAHLAKVANLARFEILTAAPLLNRRATMPRVSRSMSACRTTCRFAPKRASRGSNSPSAISSSSRLATSCSPPCWLSSSTIIGCTLPPASPDAVFSRTVSPGNKHGF